MCRALFERCGKARKTREIHLLSKKRDFLTKLCATDYQLAAVTWSEL
jgi:hypothetical protein